MPFTTPSSPPPPPKKERKIQTRLEKHFTLKSSQIIIQSLLFLSTENNFHDHRSRTKMIAIVVCYVVRFVETQMATLVACEACVPVGEGERAKPDRVKIGVRGSAIDGGSLVRSSSPCIDDFVFSSRPIFRTARI